MNVGLFMALSPRQSQLSRSLVSLLSPRQSQLSPFSTESLLAATFLRRQVARVLVASRHSPLARFSAQALKSVLVGRVARVLLANAQLAVFRPKVDEISLLTVNSSTLSPVAKEYCEKLGLLA